MKNVEDIYELSPLQRGMLFESLRDPHRGLYLQQHSCVLRGEVDATSLRHAFESLVRRHGALRTSFLWQSSERPVQVVLRKVRLPWRDCDLSRLTEGERASAVDRLLAEDRQRDFALDRAPLMRVMLLRLGRDAWRLVWTHHHAVLDGWSVSLAIGELLAAGTAFGEGRPRDESHPMRYRDFIAWLRARDAAGDERFWRETLGDLSRPTLVGRPASRARQADDVSDLAVVLDGASTERLQALARSQRITLRAVVQGAWALALHAHTGQADIVFGTVATVRPSALEGVTSALGLFLNTVPLRFRVAAEMRIADWLRKEADRPELHRHAHAAMGDIDRWSGLMDQGGIFDSLVVFESYPQERASSSRTLGFEVVDVVHGERTSYPITLFVEPGPSLHLRWSYDTARVDAAVIAGLAAGMHAALELFVARPAARVGDFHGSAPAYLREWNDTSADEDRGPDTADTLSALFARAVRRTPDAIALVFGDDAVSYADLERRVHRLAVYLSARGLEASSLVGVCLDRSIETIVAILAILESGAAYVPLDPLYPAAHLARIVDDARLSAVVTTSSLADRFTGRAFPVVRLDDGITADLEIVASARPPVPASVAYVIYTSGSTGEPKGVLAHHRGAVNRLAWMERRYPLREGEACCQTTSLGFVDSVAEIFGALTAGARLVLVTSAELRDLDALTAIISSRGISRLVVVPSLLDALLERASSEANLFAGVKHWVSSGEALEPGLARRFRTLLPGATLLNLYGSSEVAGDVAAYEVRVPPEQGSIPIGRPIANSELYVLNRRLDPVPVGATGEIYASGDGLAHGYVGRPAATAASFVPHPFATRPGDRLYRTGDIGRWLADGTVEFRGRRDRQVKVRGQRIELGAVETALRSVPLVAEAAVVQEETGSIVAYVVAKGSGDVVRELAALRAEWPEPMRPARVVPVARLPHLPNGKIDRQALLAGARTRPATAHGPGQAAARTSTEAALRELWAEILGPLADSGATFFASGGDSLSLMRLAARVRRTFEVDLPLAAFVGNLDLASLAAQIDDARRLAAQSRSADVGLPPIEPVARGGDFPLSLAQQGVWFASTLGQAGAYAERAALRIDGPVAVEALRQSIAALSRRHEALRTVFVDVGYGPVQRISPEMVLPLGIADHAALGASLPANDESSERLPTTPRFSLESGPLLRFLLVSSSASKAVLYLAVHHLVSDGWSGGVIIRELIACYESYRAGQPAPALPDLPLQHVDYVMWQRRLLESNAFRGQLEHWHADLAQESTATPPGEQPTSPHGRHDGALVSVEIPAALTGELKRFAAREQVTFFAALFAAFAIVHATDLGRSDVVIGTDLANRRGVDLENVVGLFVNQAAIRLNLAGNPRLAEVIGRVQRALLAAQSHQDVPFETIVSALRLEGSSRQAPFAVKFVLQPQPLDTMQLGELTFRRLALPAEAAKFDLLFNAYAKDGGILGELSYRTGRFDHLRADRHGRHFHALLEFLAENPRALLADAQAELAAAERKRTDTQISARRAFDRQRLATTQRRTQPSGGRFDGEDRNS